MSKWKRHSKVTYNCEWCGKENTQYYSRYKRSPRHFCSPKCSLAHRSQRVQKTVLCHQCGKPFTMSTAEYNDRVRQAPGKRMFCSRACYRASRRKKFNLICSYCGKKFTKQATVVVKNNSSGLHYCSRTCSGKDSWRARQLANERFTVKPHILRKQRRKLDDFTCQGCGITEQEAGYTLHTHHRTPATDFEDLRDAHILENLITLCIPCHNAAEAKIRQGRSPDYVL